MAKPKLTELRYRNRFLKGYSYHDYTRRLEHDKCSITVQDVLDEMTEEGKEAYFDTIEALLEAYASALEPEALWQLVDVKTISDSTVALNQRILKDSYLAERLKYVQKVNVFFVRINNELWERSKKIKDQLEKYLFSYIMTASMNHAFEGMILEIAAGMPRGCKVYMDNPGLSNGWALRQQEALMDILYNVPFSRNTEVMVDQRGFFDNAYSLTGIIYTTDVIPENAADAKLMTAKELITELYKSAGIM